MKGQIIPFYTGDAVRWKHLPTFYLKVNPFAAKTHFKSGWQNEEKFIPCLFPPLRHEC